jgi:hypothetical protein
MELKDVILSTLAEMEENASVVDSKKEKKTSSPKTTSHKIDMQEKPQEEVMIKKEDVVITPQENIHDDEMLYLTSIRERLLVLFEGFQAPNNTNIEAKVDMTLNFLEYVLATLDNRIEKIKKESRA